MSNNPNTARTKCPKGKGYADSLKIAIADLASLLKLSNITTAKLPIIYANIRV